MSIYKHKLWHCATERNVYIPYVSLSLLCYLPTEITYVHIYKKYIAIIMWQVKTQTTSDTYVRLTTWNSPTSFFFISYVNCLNCEMTYRTGTRLNWSYQHHVALSTSNAEHANEKKPSGCHPHDISGTVFTWYILQRELYVCNVILFTPWPLPGSTW